MCRFFFIFHNLLQSYKFVSKQHIFSYIFTLIASNIDTPVISKLNKLNLNLKYILYVYIYLILIYIKFGNI